MWIPILLGGAAALWYVNSKSTPETTRPKKAAPKEDRPEKHPPPELQDLLSSLISKPEEWDEIPEIPGDLIVKNKEFLKKLKAFTPEEVWGGVPDWPMEDFAREFRPPRKNFHIFIIKMGSYFLLVDGGGSNTYMKYAGRITKRAK